MKTFMIDEPVSLAMLTQWREIALQQVDDAQPQEAAAFFDLVKRLPGYFMRYHIGALGKASEHLKSQAEKQRRSLTAVGHFDLIAPYLTLDQINGYANFVRIPRVAAEINYAICSDLLVSQDARNFANNWINQRPQDWIVGKAVTLHPLNTPLMLPPAKVGETTKLAAIDVKSLEETSAAKAFDVPAPIAYPAPTARAAEPIIDLVDMSTIDLVDHMASNLYSYAIMAPSGGGKGTLVADAIRKVKEQKPHIKIMVMDAKGDDRESGNWSGVADVIHSAKFAELDYEDKEGWIREGLDLHRDIDGASLLIFDEATMVFGYAKNIKSLYNRLIDFVTCTASSGNSSEKYVWLLGHSPNLSDYGLSGGQMVSFHKLFIAPSSNIGAVKQLGLTTFAGTFGDDKVSQIIATGQSSEVSRAVYLSTTDTWYPMAKLKLHSGYNRDKREFEPGFCATVESVPVQIEWHDEEFISRLAAELRTKDPKQLDYLTPQAVLKTEAAQKRKMTVDQAKIAIKKAMTLI